MTISTNITPETALSGSPAILSFSMSYNSAGGTIHPDPAKFRAVVTSPSDVDVAIIGNDMFRLEGTDNTSIPGFTVTTMVFNQLPAAAAPPTLSALPPPWAPSPTAAPTTSISGGHTTVRSCCQTSPSP